jgi:hypothetical protein
LFANVIQLLNEWDKESSASSRDLLIMSVNSCGTDVWGNSHCVCHSRFRSCS